MNLFFCTATGQQFARLLLAKMGRDVLFSYANKENEKLWEEALRVYFVAAGTGNIRDYGHPLLTKGAHNTLLSFAEKKGTESFMQIHLADTSPEKGQCQALIDLSQNNHLVGHAYKDAHQFDEVWDEQTNDMRPCLVGHTANKDTEQMRTSHENHLSIFANQEEVSALVETVVDRKKLPRILVDSGAFTAFTTGKQIYLDEFVEWCLYFKKKWEPVVQSLHFFNLDVIGDEEKSDINLIRCEKKGLDPIPVFTFQGDIKYLQKYLEYPYFSFGGLVGKTTKQQQEWLDYCFKFVFQYRQKKGRLPKIHLLGVTKQVLLERYPVYSCDSSSWIKCLRFGIGDAIGRKKVPRYKESPENLKITIATLRAEIKRYQRMEEEVTLLWKKRGIEWSD